MPHHSLFFVTPCDARFKTDILDKEALNKVFAENKIDTVIHCAVRRARGGHARESAREEWEWEGGGVPLHQVVLFCSPCVLAERGFLQTEDMMP